jgi:hypothetical protein
MFHYADSTDGEIVVPELHIKVIAFKRFNASKKLLLVENQTSLGVDLDGEEDTANTVYRCNRKVKIKIGFKYVCKSHSQLVLKVTA